MKLSVLVPTTHRRLTTTLPRVITSLSKQMENLRGTAEIICVLDNESMSIGEKVNEMVRVARGKFVSVVADDDTVSDDYVQEVLAAIDEAPDSQVICYDCAYYIGDGEGYYTFTHTIREGKDYGDRQTIDSLYRNPSDKMCWSRQFRLDHPCEDTWECSDTHWAKTVNPLIEREARIEKSLYHFYYNPANPQGKRYREKLDKQPRPRG